MQRQLEDPKPLKKDIKKEKIVHKILSTTLSSELYLNIISSVTL